MVYVKELISGMSVTRIGNQRSCGSINFKGIVASVKMTKSRFVMEGRLFANEVFLEFVD